MSTMPSNMPAPQPPARKISPWVWILGGIAVVMFGGMLTCGVVGFLGMRMLKNAGFDSELMRTNPGLAMAKMATAMNSNLELISSNDRAGTVTMRDKTTGKTITYKFDADKKTLEIVGENGEQVTINGDGNKGAMTVQSPDGTVKIGAGSGPAPSWVPVYPGSNPQAAMSSQGRDGNTHTFSFKTGDAVDKVMQYYQDQLKSGGFNVTLTTSSAQGGMLSAEDGEKKRTIIVTVSSSAQGVEGTVMTTEK